MKRFLFESKALGAILDFFFDFFFDNKGVETDAMLDADVEPAEAVSEIISCIFIKIFNSCSTVIDISLQFQYRIVVELGICHRSHKVV